MSSEFSVSDNAKELISEIIKTNNWEPVTDVKYYPGTEAGDGHMTKHVAVDITSGNKIFRLFVKYPITTSGSLKAELDKFYVNEAYFYDVVYAAYAIFLKEKKIENCFHNVPKCYGTSTKNVIILENIKEKGFTLFNRKEIMNDNHIKLTLKTFAKFHACSFAFKDQEREKYDKLEDGVNSDFLGPDMEGLSAKSMEAMLNDGLRKFDPEVDKHIIEKCDAGVLLKSIIDSRSYFGEYAIITQGDCWCNNIMFRYEKDNRECPTDVILVDWQLCRIAPPVLDVAYFFYTIACEESLNKLDTYLEVYYAELQEQIKILGSDPDKLYPFPVFQKQWKQYCKYGFAMAFIIYKVMLINNDEISDRKEKDTEELRKTGSLFSNFKNEDEYIRRIRILGEFMVKNDYL